MRRWSIVLSFFYLLVLFVIWFPIIGLLNTRSLKYFDYSSVWFLLFIAIISIFGSALLIFLSVDTSQKRLRPKRSLRASIISTGFLLALLIGGAISSMLIALIGDAGVYPSFSIVPIVLWIIWMIIAHKGIKLDNKDNVRLLRIRECFRVTYCCTCSYHFTIKR